MIRLGLCCVFRDEPIKFRTATAAVLSRLDRAEAVSRLSTLCLANADALLAALRFCAAAGIGCFRVNSQVLPLKTQPKFAYDVAALPDGEEIVARFRACGEFVRANGLRTCFHPDQFVVLNSRRPEVVAASLRELEYQAEVAEWIGAESGLGLAMMHAMFGYQMADLWAILVIATAINGLLVVIFSLIARVATPWHESAQRRAEV